MKDKANQFLVTDLLENILPLASHPRECGEYITTRIRTMVGVKIVALMQAPITHSDQEYSVVSVCPARYREMLSHPEINEFCRLSETSPSLVKVGPGALTESNDKRLPAEFNDSIVIPLKSGDEHVGALLLLNLLSTDGLGSVTDALENLSGVIGLIFKNSILFQNLDDLVIERTKELEQEILFRREAERTLRRYRHIVANSTDMVALLDRDYTYLTANDAYAQQFNLTVAQITGQTVLTVVGEKLFHEVIKPHADTCMQGKKVNYQEWFVFPAHEEPRYMDITYFPYYNSQNEIVGFVVNGRNITERKRAEEERARLEEQLRQAHKMEAIGTLAGGIAHDFNNILASIIGYSDMALEDLPPHSPVREPIEQVISSGYRARDLVSHILSFSRQRGQKRESVEIHKIVAEGLKLLRASIPTTIDIQQDVDPTCGYVLADPTQIHQIILNLCTNGAQAMERSGGILHVSLSRLEVTESERPLSAELKLGSYVCLTVQDNGVGIEQQHIDKIFDPYFTTKEVGKGSGMGLAVVLGIVKQHDGVITVDSRPGEGSAFTVYFPSIQREKQEKVDSHVLPIEKGDESILVVDDEQAIVTLNKARLERLGYKVTAETNSTKALDLFRSNPNDFDLILSDQTMPGLTGENLAKEAISIRPDIPVIICSGYSSQMDPEKANVSGIGAFIMKPVEYSVLARTIRQILDEK